MEKIGFTDFKHQVQMEETFKVTQCNEYYFFNKFIK